MLAHSFEEKHAQSKSDIVTTDIGLHNNMEGDEENQKAPETEEATINSESEQISDNKEGRENGESSPTKEGSGDLEGGKPTEIKTAKEDLPGEKLTVIQETPKTLEHSQSDLSSSAKNNKSNNGKLNGALDEQTKEESNEDRTAREAKEDLENGELNLAKATKDSPEAIMAAQLKEMELLLSTYKNMQFHSANQLDANQQRKFSSYLTDADKEAHIKHEHKLVLAAPQNKRYTYLILKGVGVPLARRRMLRMPKILSPLAEKLNKVAADATKAYLAPQIKLLNLTLSEEQITDLMQILYCIIQKINLSQAINNYNFSKLEIYNYDNKLALTLDMSDFYRKISKALIGASENLTIKQKKSVAEQIYDQGILCCLTVK